MRGLGISFGIRFGDSNRLITVNSYYYFYLMLVVLINRVL